MTEPSLLNLFQRAGKILRHMNFEKYDSETPRAVSYYLPPEGQQSGWPHLRKVWPVLLTWITDQIQEGIARVSSEAIC